MDESKLAIAERMLDRSAAWVSHAEVKAGGILALDGVLAATCLGRAREAIEVLPLGVGYQISLLVSASGAVVGIGWSLLWALLAVRPALGKNDLKNPFYFGDAARMPAATFKALVRASTDESLADRILDQVHVVSTIATRKFHLLVWSVWGAFLAVPCTLGFVFIPLLEGGQA